MTVGVRRRCAVIRLVATIGVRVVQERASGLQEGS
eukprot:CAMPEP_0113264830 /NCGR_PEP_ID=MMETSP0008_2-20120614/19177_1 /TAXON_ID=97485 /ORGANISM="Prymnesium parvum" /LENGTH=34 /DNA_ID=CAMNT_0000113607 /DNA_START=553 /DNA_END=654 /DNA_ORIENTATION=- /assembly_acc=CAM_ASM_000153